jgi:NAD(P)H-dependent flavin oxidoreductase YrpB (nitropropane dioxygenase family)
MKIGAPVERFGAGKMVEYAELCGWALARAHARSGASAQISAYLGDSDAFDTAVAAFAQAYADQTERDHAVFKQAVRAGHLKAILE